MAEFHAQPTSYGHLRGISKVMHLLLGALSPISDYTWAAEGIKWSSTKQQVPSILVLALSVKYIKSYSLIQIIRDSNS